MCGFGRWKERVQGLARDIFQGKARPLGSCAPPDRNSEPSGALNVSTCFSQATQDLEALQAPHHVDGNSTSE